MTTKFSIFDFLASQRSGQFLVLAGILTIASFLRLYQLSHVPPSPSLDEVSIGYNAYSILKTTKDEYGIAFPMLLRAYDDWRPALYVYLVVPFIKLFGLTTFSVRLPSVILSVATVLATYFLAKEMLRNSKIALLATFFLAISPWHIYISRLGHEANAGLAFFILALTCFFHNKVLFSVVFFALSFISYQSEKIFLPFFIVAFIFLFWEKIKSNWKKFFLGFFLSLFILIPFMHATLQPEALIRFQGTNIFSANYDLFQKRGIMLQKAVEENDMLGEIVHNRRVVAMQLVLENYLAHFNPQWLFFNKGVDRHKVPNMGLFYLWEAPFMLAGVWYLFRKSKKILLFFLFWILLSPIPAAVTTDAPHAMRTYTLLPVPQFLTAFGILSLLSKIMYLPKYVLFLLCFVFFLFNFLFLFKNYFVIFPKTQSSSFQYALSQAISFVLGKEKSYNTVVFSNKDNLYQSYMFFLFYSRYDPHLYQKFGGTISGGFAQTHAFEKYEFRAIDFDQEKKKNVLYVGNLADFPKNIKPVKIFSDLAGRESVVLVEK